MDGANELRVVNGRIVEGRDCAHGRFKTVADVRPNGDGAWVLRVSVVCLGCGTPMKFPEFRYVSVEEHGLKAVVECELAGD